jgi:hypothetical protein
MLRPNKLTKSMALLLSAWLSSEAQAASLTTFACGRGRENGPLKSEIGIIFRVEDDIINQQISIYFDGRKVAIKNEQIGVRGGDDIIMFWFRLMEADRTLQFDIRINSKTLVQRLYSDVPNSYELKSPAIPCVIVEK